MTKIGVVIIGRNEGERLKACIRSLSGSGDFGSGDFDSGGFGSGLKVVYVDSNSSDGSVNFVKNARF